MLITGRIWGELGIVCCYAPNDVIDMLAQQLWNDKLLCKYLGNLTLDDAILTSIWAWSYTDYKYMTSFVSENGIQRLLWSAIFQWHYKLKFFRQKFQIISNRLLLNNVLHALSIIGAL